MKHLFLSLATTTTLLLILLSITTTTASGDKTVYDVLDEPLIAGQKYYIIPYSYNALGGGFTWKRSYDFGLRCPPYHLIQYNDNTNSGQPTTFKPLSSSTQSDEIITLSTKLNIEFMDSPQETPQYHCGRATGEWKVEDYEVELGGQSGLRDPNKYVFTIEDLKDGGYTIRFCPRHRFGRYACGGLGIVMEDGERRLVVNGTDPLAVVFEPETLFIKKVTSYA